tara:strand:+ start:2433 stop:2816 length:384 start_codon:yes stop_codon:yes gene_type:complete
MRDIQNIYDKKQTKKQEYYNQIMVKIINLMKKSAEEGKNMCIYVIPNLIFGMPIYNLDECMLYIISNLKQNGFECTYALPNIILVFWKLENKLLKDIRLVRKSDTIKKIEYNSVNKMKAPKSFFSNN